MLDPKTFCPDSRAGLSGLLPTASHWVMKKQLGSKFLTYQQCCHLFVCKGTRNPNLKCRHSAVSLLHGTMICVGLQKRPKALGIVFCMHCAASPGQDQDLIVLGAAHKCTENRPYPQDLARKIDKAKEKGSLPVFQLGKAGKALCA